MVNLAIDDPACKVLYEYGCDNHIKNTVIIKFYLQLFVAYATIIKYVDGLPP